MHDTSSTSPDTPLVVEGHLVTAMASGPLAIGGGGVLLLHRLRADAPTAEYLTVRVPSPALEVLEALQDEYPRLRIRGVVLRTASSPSGPVADRMIATAVIVLTPGAAHSGEASGAESLPPAPRPGG
jgi:hypothetical protein